MASPERHSSTMNSFDFDDALIGVFFIGNSFFHDLSLFGDDHFIGATFLSSSFRLALAASSISDKVGNPSVHHVVEGPLGISSSPPV